MALVSVSRGTNMGGRRLAEQLARELNYVYVTREELADYARERGVPVDELQEAVHQPPIKFAELRRERLAYLSCIRGILCRRVLDENIVYDGHAGHMLLSGVPNILRVRVVADLDFRIHAVMQEMGMSFADARKHVAYVDLDRDRWSRFLYNVDWRDLFYYDMLINLSQTGINHAAELLAEMAKMEEFHLTEEARLVLRNVELESEAQFRLLTDERTRGLSLRVSANQGHVTVVGGPADAESLTLVPSVLAGLEAAKDVQVTIATSTILLLQDRYKKKSDSLQCVERLAEQVDGAAYLMRLAHPDTTAGADFFDPSSTRVEEVGVEITEASHPDPDHVIDEGPGDDLAACARQFERCSRSAGLSTFYGSADWLLSHLQAHNDYSTIVLGDLFLHRPPATRIRLREHLRMLMAERLEIPIVTTDEIKERMQIRTRDIARLAGLLLSAAVLVGLMIWKQDAIADFMSYPDRFEIRLLIAGGVLLATPIFAFTYGSAIKAILRVIRFE